MRGKERREERSTGAAPPAPRSVVSCGDASDRDCGGCRVGRDSTVSATAAGCRLGGARITDREAETTRRPPPYGNPPPPPVTI